jgi:hypothetical protein
MIYYAGETVLGDPTYGQVDDYLKVCEYENTQLDHAIGGCTAWISSDPVGFDAFNDRANAVSKRLPPLVSTLRESMRGHAMTQGIDLGTKALWDELRAWRQDLNAVWREFSANPHGCAVPELHDPQPQAADPQLEALKTATEATHTIEQAAKSVGTVGVQIGFGVVAVLVAALAIPVLVRR